MVLKFRLFLDRFLFLFYAKKTLVFCFWWLLWFVAFLFFSICSFVFVKNTIRFFRFGIQCASQFFLFWFQFLFHLRGNDAPLVILNSHEMQMLLRRMCDKPNVIKITSQRWHIMGIDTTVSPPPPTPLPPTPLPPTPSWIILGEGERVTCKDLHVALCYRKWNKLLLNRPLNSNSDLTFLLIWWNFYRICEFYFFFRSPLN